MVRLVRLLMALGFISGVYLPTATLKAGQPDTLFIQRDHDVLSVSAGRIPHRRILEELANQLHFELIIAGPLEEERSLDIERRPWEEALKKALAPASWAFVYDSSSGEPRLSKVFVFPSKEASSGGTRTLSPPRREPEPASVPLPKPEPPPSNPPILAEKGIDASLAELLNAEDEEMRALALVGLATVGGEQAIAALRQALQDQEPWIRETAVEALAEIGGEQAIQGLQQALADNHEDVRRAAQEALARLQPTPQ